MSVLIKDMEFPKTCNKCPIMVSQDEFIYCPLCDSHTTEKQSKRQRMKSCRLEDGQETSE